MKIPFVSVLNIMKTAFSSILVSFALLVLIVSQNMEGVPVSKAVRQ